MVPSKIRCKKRNRNRGTFREINAGDEHERTIEANKKAEESSLFHNDNIIIHVHATQWIKYYCILYGDYSDKSNDHVDHSFDCSNHQQYDRYVDFDFDNINYYLFILYYPVVIEMSELIMCTNLKPFIFNLSLY